jgi:hypothetical protein
MVCVCVPLLLKRNFGVLFGVLGGPHSYAVPHNNAKKETTRQHNNTDHK